MAASLRAYLLFSMVAVVSLFLSLSAQVVVAVPDGDEGDADDPLLTEVKQEVLQDPGNTLPYSLLLQILRAESPLQPPEPHNSNNNIDNDQDNDVSIPNPSDANDDNNNNAVVKRVFCNGFTGCGGRHRQLRRRRRLLGKRLIPVLVKRPFCNSLGCFKTRPNMVAGSGGGLTKARLLTQGLTKAAEGSSGAEREEGEDGRRKRLFCNGYGGCRGGKRSLFSPWMSKMNSVADSLP